MSIDRIDIPESPGLDQITIYADSLGGGRGMLTVVCFGSAWSAYWGSMGCEDVREFASSCNVAYVHDNLIWGLNQLARPTAANRTYLMKVVVAVHAALQPFKRRRAA